MEVITMRLPKDINLLPKYISNDIYQKVGSAIAKDMMISYRSAIKSFYDDYKPWSYHRLYRSYYFVNPDGTRAYTKLIHPDDDGKGFSVSMNITPDNIRVPYRSITGGFSSGKKLNEIVFTNTFVYGQHGGRLPWDILPEDDRPKIGTDRWKSRNGRFIWEPPRMEISPKEQLDMWFDNYTMSNKINKKIDKITIESIERFLKNYKKQHIK